MRYWDPCHLEYFGFNENDTPSIVSWSSSQKKAGFSGFMALKFPFWTVSSHIKLSDYKHKLYACVYFQNEKKKKSLHKLM